MECIVQSNGQLVNIFLLFNELLLSLCSVGSVNLLKWSDGLVVFASVLQNFLYHRQAPCSYLLKMINIFIFLLKAKPRSFQHFSVPSVLFNLG